MEESELIATLEAGLAHHQAGRIPQAEEIYRQVLDADRQNPDALHLLGVAAHQQGRAKEAVELIQRAIEIEDSIPDYYSNLGEAFLAFGKPQEAADAYQKALKIEPGHLGASVNFGKLLTQAKQYDDAILLYQSGIASKPNAMVLYYNLGVAYMAANRLDEGAEMLTSVVQQQPQFVDGWLLLGRIYHQQNRLQDALGCYKQVATNFPNHAQAHAFAGDILLRMGRRNDAIQALLRAAQLSSQDADSQDRVGVMLASAGQLPEAEACFLRATQLKPRHPLAWTHLGATLHAQRRFAEAVAPCRKAIDLNPGEAAHHFAMGECLRLSGRVDEALPYYERAMELQPTTAPLALGLGIAQADAHHPAEAEAAFRKAFELDSNLTLAVSKLAEAMALQGRHEEAEKTLREGLAKKPDSTALHSQLLQILNCYRGNDAELLWREHQAWNNAFVAPLAKNIQPHTNEPSTDRALRVGYVSSDFRDHPTAAFLKPILESHDLHFTTIIYSDVEGGDAVTKKFEQDADEWRDISRLPHDAVAELIRRDKVDILVDLTGHSGRSRLSIFARQPAPILLTFLGYPGSTGVNSIAYRVTDSVLDPAGETEKFNSEELLRLDPCCFTYRAPEGAPEVAPLPALARGFVTFGSFNDLMQVTDETVAMWARVLNAVPNSRMLLVDAALAGAAACDRMAHRFARWGVTRERLTMRGRPDNGAQLLAAHNEVDIALDTYPLSGAASTCNALWMGVPVVTLTGNTPATRRSATLLSAVDAAQLITTSADAFVKLAAEMSRDLKILAELREGMRQQVSESSLVDCEGFTGELEQAYRQVWEKWCKG